MIIILNYQLREAVANRLRTLYRYRIKLRKVIRQENGMSLIEVLAVIVITSMIVGTAIALLYTIQTTANVSTKQEMQQTSVRWTTKQLQNELTKATYAVFVSSSEARFLFGNKMKALIFDPTKLTWTWYEYHATPASTDEQIKLAMNDTTYSLATTPDIYTFDYELSDSITTSPIWTIKASTGDTPIVSYPKELPSSALLGVNLQFTGVRSDSLGRPVIISDDKATQVQMTIKLLSIQ